MSSAITFLPLLGAIIVLFLPNDNTIKRFSILWSIIPLILSTVAWATMWSFTPPYNFVYNACGAAIDSASAAYTFGECAPWIPVLGIQYHLGTDGLSMPLIWLTTLLTTLSLFYSARVIEHRVREFFALFLLLEVGMLGVFVSLDLFLFYIFWEIGLVPMYFLIGIWGHEEDRPQYAAIKFFLYTLAGSVFMLLGIIALYLYSTPNTFDMTLLATGHANMPFSKDVLISSLAFLGFFLAFAIKMPLFPFHTWLPDAHTAAPTAGSVILAGILLKLGGYGFFRVLLPIFPQVAHDWAFWIGVLAVISIVYGSLVAMAQMDFKRLIAYSSVGHMGFVILGFAAAAALTGEQLQNAGYLDSGATAINGAVIAMISHGVITGGLFFLVGMLYERTHTRDLTQFGGFGAQVPVYGALLLLTSFASLGLPGLAGFVGEFLVLRGAYTTLTTLAFIGVLGVVFTAAYFLWKVIQKVLLGTADEKWAKLPDLKGFEILTLAPLAVLMFVIGIYPTWIIDTINFATVEILRLMATA
ncbi:MAG: NADH-quinone oxidoreductase subunit M [Chloroflexi bacterium]|nr:NADH-quinone oxidoreductase subunit M [Chloroflexota bacterium]